MDDRTLEAARLYYLHDETMDAIASRFGTSRSTVSRLLADARRRGLVTISVATPATDSALARLVARRFDARLHVVPTRSAATPLARLEQVAAQAAQLLSDAITDRAVVGVAWGTTVAAIAARLPRRDVRGVQVVQLNGAANQATSGIPVMAEVGARAAEAFGASVTHFPVPAFFDYADTRAALWRERSVRHVLDLQARAGVCVFGVGSFEGPLPSHVYAAGYLSAEEMDALRADGVVGDVCTVLLRRDGTYADIPLNARASGPTPAELRRIPRRICAAAGEPKAAAVAGALRAGVATDLVVDAQLAAALEIELG